MAHFAELDNNNVVQRVIVVSNKNTSDENGVEDENIGIAFCKTLYGSDTNWRQCSRSLRIRRRFPRRGDLYVESSDVFVHPQPYESWSLDSDAYWQPPLNYPELTDTQVAQGYRYDWNEGEYQNGSENCWDLHTPQIITINSQPTDVTISAGSSATFDTSATINHGEIRTFLQREIDTNVWAKVVNAHITESKVYSGILTTQDSGNFRVAFEPDVYGNVGYSSVVTVTVTD